MKESYSFQPSKEVVEILREIEKQTEETHNKIRIEMGPLAYSRLMDYSFPYFNIIISLQRVVGFLLLKSCLMALAKTFAFPLPSF